MSVPTGYPQALGEAMRTLLDNPVLRASLASRGRSTAERFSQDNMKDRWLNIVERALMAKPEAV